MGKLFDTTVPIVTVILQGLKMAMLELIILIHKDLNPLPNHGPKQISSSLMWFHARFMDNRSRKRIRRLLILLF